MNRCAAFFCRTKLFTLLLLTAAGLSGCGSNSGSSGGSGSSTAYYSVTHYDPWYYGGYYDDVDVYVPGYPVYPSDPDNRPERPQRGDGINRPTNPIARPGRPEGRPSLPSRARPMGYSRPSGFSRGSMGGMRGGRRR